MPKPNSFDVMKAMSAQNKDIKMFPDVVSAQTVKLGGHVTFGTDAATVHAMAIGTPKYKVFMLALNEADYEQVSAELEALMNGKKPG